MNAYRSRPTRLLVVHVWAWRAVHPVHLLVVVMVLLLLLLVL